MTFIRKIKAHGRIYLSEVKSIRIGKKVKQKVIRYLGRQADDNKNILPETRSDIAFEHPRIYGSVLALDYIAKKIGLYELLGEHAPTILTIVYCHCHDYKSIKKVRQWFNKTDLRKIFGISDITEKMVQNAFLKMENIDHLSFQKILSKNIMNFCKEDASSVLYDVTNTYFTGRSCKIAKKGKDKDGVRGRKLIQIGLVITKKFGLPIFHQIHPGNVHDSKIFSEAITYLKLLKISSGVIIHDRGMTAKDNVLKLINEKWTIIAGIAMHKGIKKIALKINLKKLQKAKNIISQGSTTIFYVIKKRYSLGKNKGFLIVILNLLKKNLSKTNRDLDIFESIKKSQNNNCINDPKKLDKRKLDQLEQFDGLSFLFTNSKLPKKEIIRLYFEKDLIEKSFHSLKGVLSLRPIRMWIDENVKAHVFFCYLGYALLSIIRCKLLKSPASMGLLEISVEEALEELTAIYRIYFHQSSEKHKSTDEQFRLITLTKLQKSILKAISPDLTL